MLSTSSFSMTIMENLMMMKDWKSNSHRGNNLERQHHCQLKIRIRAGTKSHRTLPIVPISVSVSHKQRGQRVTSITCTQRTTNSPTIRFSAVTAESLPFQKAGPPHVNNRPNISPRRKCTRYTAPRCLVSRGRFNGTTPSRLDIAAKGHRKVVTDTGEFVVSWKSCWCPKRSPSF